MTDRYRLTSEQILRQITPEIEETFTENFLSVCGDRAASHALGRIKNYVSEPWRIIRAPGYTDRWVGVLNMRNITLASDDNLLRVRNFGPLSLVYLDQALKDTFRNELNYSG